MKSNQKLLCKRHYPVLFPLYNALCFVLERVIPWALVTLACAGVAGLAVELITHQAQ